MTEVLQAEIKALRDYVDTRFGAIEEARKLAAEGIVARLVTMNEFRGSIDDVIKTFVSRSELDARAVSEDKRIKSLEISRAYFMGAVAVASIVGGIVAGAIVRIVS